MYWNSYELIDTFDCSCLPSELHLGHSQLLGKSSLMLPPSMPKLSPCFFCIQAGCNISQHIPHSMSTRPVPSCPHIFSVCLPSRLFRWQMRQEAAAGKTGYKIYKQWYILPWLNTYCVVLHNATTCIQIALIVYLQACNHTGQKLKRPKAATITQLDVGK